jgi:hypothetical protein
VKRYASMLVLTFLGALTAWSVFGQTKSTTGGSHDSSNQGASYSVRTLPLPDNNAGNVSMDYIAYDPSTNSVWVPGGNTGAVDVVDVATDKVRQIPGFPTKEVETSAGKRVFGPNAVSIGANARGIEALRSWLDGFWDEALLAFKETAERQTAKERKQ